MIIPSEILNYKTIGIRHSTLGPSNQRTIHAVRIIFRAIKNGRKHVYGNTADWLQEMVRAQKMHQVIQLLRLHAVAVA